MTMCGIVGWINVKQDLTEQRQVIEKMSETLFNRGPDEFGYYIGENALFSNRRLIVVDPAGGVQPMTKTVAGRSYTLVYNGELYNTEEIHRALKAKGFALNSRSDTEALLVSYLAWGPQCVDHLNGIYAFAVWDHEQKQLFAARDRLGVKPLFYTQQGDSFIFGSEIKALLAHPGVEPVVGETGLLEIFGLGPARSPGSGIFKDIHELRPGCCLTFGSGGLKTRHYWKLENKPHTETLDETVDHVRSLVVDAVERQLISDVPVCTFLSGGIDSSAISAIAAGVFRRSGAGRLKTFSLDFCGNDQHFKPGPFEPDADACWVNMMAGFIGSDHHHILIDTPELAAALREAVLANDYPGMADIDSSLYLFCREVKKFATVALSGECADEIFGGYPWFRKEEDIHARTFPWSKSLEHRRKILAKTLSTLHLEDYVEACYSQSIREVPAAEDATPLEQRMRELFYLNYQWFMLTLLNRKDRMSMANSLEVRVPYADHRIVEYTWNIPEAFKFCDNAEKGLLRRALQPLLPPEIVTRKKSPYPKTHHPAYAGAVRGWLTKVLQDPSAPIHQLIDSAAVKEIIHNEAFSGNAPWFGQLMRGPQFMAYLIQLNIWLEEYKIRLL